MKKLALLVSAVVLSSGALATTKLDAKTLTSTLKTQKSTRAIEQTGFESLVYGGKDISRFHQVLEVNYPVLVG